MKILVVTGLLAKEAVLKSVGDSADILVLPIPVAALITPQKLLSGFLNSEFSNRQYDAVLVSGFSKFNFSNVEKEIGCPVYLGPKHAVDLKSALSAFSFSKTIPACELIQSHKTEQAKLFLDDFEKTNAGLFQIGAVSIGGTSRMKILAEIVAVESLSKEELHAQIKYLIEEGADLIDLGFSPDADEQTVSSAIAFSKSVCPVPISIDSGNFSQIHAGILAGVDLVLSLDSGGLEQVASFVSTYSDAVFKTVSFVIIPDLSSSKNKTESLSQNILKAQQLGFEKIIADPILSPPGHDLFLSLKDYYDFRQSHPDIPILFGVGNVTELFDADSVGMNALLTELADEFGASILFTPNASDKGKGSVYELKTASEMMILSKNRASSPKDLGIDLLILKEKRKRPDFNLNLISKSEAFSDLHLQDNQIPKSVTQNINKNKSDSTNDNSQEIILSGSLHPNFTSDTKWGWKSDLYGNFLIGLVSVSDLVEFISSSFSSDSVLNSGLDLSLQKWNEIKTPGRRVIVAVHQKAIIIGTDSAFMLESVLKQNLISELSHAGYLGRELQKAEIALRFGRSYTQDDVF